MLNITVNIAQVQNGFTAQIIPTGDSNLTKKTAIFVGETLDSLLSDVSEYATDTYQTADTDDEEK